MRLRFLLLLCALSAAVYGQTGTATIQGTVKDVTGAVVPGAAITAEHSDTARRYSTTANGVGFYLLPSLPTGNYTLSVQAAGMERWSGKLLLQVGQTAEVDATLKVGATTTEVTVAGDVTPLVTTTSATLGNVVERARIEQLPLNGRFFQALVAADHAGRGGQQRRAAVYGPARRHGVHAGRRGAGQPRNGRRSCGRPPGIDTMQEFRVETNNSSAKMNRPASAMIVNTRAGTNQLHGAAFETARNNGFGRGARAPGLLSRSRRTWCATSSAPRWAARCRCPRSTTARTGPSSSSPTRPTAASLRPPPAPACRPWPCGRAISAA